MAFLWFYTFLLNLFLITICLPLIVSTNVSTNVSINTTKIQCDYQKYGSEGCPPDSHMVCNNATKYCHCNESGQYGISFGDDQCLQSGLNIDEKCYVSSQCKTLEKYQLFCFVFDPILQKVVKLENSFALDLKQRLNKTIQGFCRCDDNYYYDYEENKCLHSDAEEEVAPFIDDIFCKQCSLLDQNSYCDRKRNSCLCKKGYHKNGFGKCTPTRFLYEMCTQSDECVISNTYCESIVGQCICEDGYYADRRKQLCRVGKALYEKCGQTSECTYIWGYCDPKENQCVCDPNTSVLFNLQCVQKTPYGHKCNDLFPDLICELSSPHTICSKYNNRCVCENGFLFISNECQRININRFAFGDDMRPIDDNRNPMTYILIFFCTIFFVTIIASILIKLFRRPVVRLPLAAYDTTRSSAQPTNSNYYSPEPRGAPSAPPVYSESSLRDIPLNVGSNSDSDDKPPSYEEAISGQFPPHY